MRSRSQETEQVTLGVDTHAEFHVAAALDERGQLLGFCTIPTTSAGFGELLRWAGQYGDVARVGIEGTGCYGAGLARWLRARGVAVLEVDRPDRRTRRRRGKSDTVDAEAAARAVLAGIATGQPKAGTGPMEMLRTLRVARQSAMKARTQAANELHALLVTAPEAVRTQLRRLKVPQLVATAAAFRLGPDLATPTAATKAALKSIARRYQHLSAEIDALDAHLEHLVAAAAPALMAIKGVGTDIATTLLTTAGDNPDRLASEGSFAHLVGVAPISASSGKTVRHRLNRGGDRQGNRALYLLAIGRMGWDPATRAYVARRTTEGRTKPEIIRCLKRYIARELYPLLVAITPTLGSATVLVNTSPAT
ncbi:MAG: IS110 family transposase [Chloroflexota bacterium]|nr:IS110 family transposase [Chloroflexota bacterium]